MNRIECCFINRLNGCDDLFSQLDKRDNVKVETFNCIGNCSVCVDHFHCLVNGVRYVAQTEEGLHQLVMKNLK